MRRLAAWLGAALVAHAAPVAADPADWLERVGSAARDTNYSGVIVYRDAQVMEVLRVVHRNRDGKVQERLTSLTGRPRDILHEGDRVAWHGGEGGPEVAGGVPRGLFPQVSAQALRAAAQHYEFRELGEARVAGRPCLGVMMVPRDEYRYGYEICADRATAVPLRVTLLDPAGRTVEQVLFTEVAFPRDIADAAFEAPSGAAAAATPESAPATAPDVTDAPPAWQLARLPPGFRVVLRSRRLLPGGGVVEHVLISDGVSAVSVFGAPPDAAGMFSGLSHMGAMNAYARIVGTLHVTVVGEVPQSTVRMIGDGLQPAGAPAAAPQDAAAPR
jgi:sigma-E factor negative regulatory protein RseB